MRKIKVIVSTDIVNSDVSKVIEVSEHIPESQVDEIIWETVCDMINFTTEEIEE